MDLLAAFRRNRDERPDAPAFLVTNGDRSVPVSWRRFADDIALFSRVIERYAPGAVIGILGENSCEWMTAHAACLFCGAVAVPVDVSLHPSEIVRRLSFVGAGVLLYSSRYEDKARAVAREMPGLLAGGFTSEKADRLLDEARAAIARDGRTVFDRDGVDRSRTATIVFTSGTTSEPRGVELTLAAIETFCDAWRGVHPMKEGERSLMLLPTHHIFGLCVAYLMLAHRVALGVCPDFRRLYDAAVRFRVTYLFLVPALADVLAQKMERQGPDEPLARSLTWILVGGAPMPDRTAARLSALGVKTIAGYGLTETAALYSVAPGGEPFRTGSAGRVPRIAGVETKVSPDGELMIRGPNVMKGYFRSPEATARVLSADGWFRTGDRGRIDADGTVWIAGRASRTIVLLSGKKIAPEELENKLLLLPGIAEALVSGDAVSREIRAEIYPSADQASVRRAVAALNATLPVHERISRVVFRTEPFPRTASGKISLARPAGSPGASPARRTGGAGRALPIATAFLLSAGIVVVWLSHAVPDIWSLFGEPMPEDRMWICRLFEEIGEGAIVASLLMAIVALKRFVMRWRRPAGR